jgi:hypothetical protein
VAEELLPGEHLAGVAHERLGEEELAGAERDLAVADPRPAGAQVQLEPAVPQHRHLGDPVAAQPQPHPGEQLLEPERLGHVVVGAAPQPGEGVVDAASGGEHDHRHRHPGAA